MRFSDRLFRFFVVLIIFALLILVFWFVIASYKYNYGFNETISYMARTIHTGWQAVVSFFTTLFTNTAT